MCDSGVLVHLMLLCLVFFVGWTRVFSSSS
jgi:hypothetical protein